LWAALGQALLASTRAYIGTESTAQWCGENLIRGRVVMVLAPWAVDLHAHLGSQNPKAILDIMVRDALDEIGENFLRLILGRVFHYFEQPGCQGCRQRNS
jgi:hypothetical protein